MARRTALTPVPAARWALGAALALALLLHAAAWWWIEPLLAWREAQVSLHSFAKPMYTRVIAPAQTAAAPAQRTTPPAVARAPAAPAARVVAPRDDTVAADATAKAAEADANADADADAIAATQAMAAASDAPGTALSADAGSPSMPPRADAVPQPTDASAADAAAAATPAAPAASTAPAPDPYAAWPADTRLSYRLQGQFRGPVDGDAQVTWQRVDDRYQVQIAIRLALFVRVTLTSQGRIVNDRLQPEIYQEQMPNRTRSVRLAAREVVLGNGTVLSRPDGVQDTASQFVALSHRFASGLQHLSEGEAVRFWMARPGGVDEWTYDVRAPESLATRRWGEVQAFALVPRPIERPRGNITAQMWFAPSLQHLPARIRIAFGDEAWLDLTIDQIEQVAR